MTIGPPHCKPLPEKAPESPGFEGSRGGAGIVLGVNSLVLLVLPLGLNPLLAWCQRAFM